MIFYICGGFDIVENPNTTVYEHVTVVESCGGFHSFYNPATDVVYEHVTLAKRKDDVTLAQRKDTGVYHRQIKDTLGRIRQIKYEPRLKREKQSLSLGTYNTYDDAKIVRDIAAFFYGDDEFGCLDFEDGRSFAAKSNPEDSRYFVIPPLTEKEGEEKSKLVSRKAKEVFKQFKEKQAEYREHRDLWLAMVPIMEGSEEEVGRGDDVVNGEGHVNGHLEARTLDLTNTALQHPSHNSQDGNSVMRTTMLGNHGVTSNIFSPFDDTFEPTPSDATNCSPLSDCHIILESSMEGAPALSGEEFRRVELPGSHILSYEAGPTVAPALFSNITPASGFNSNTGNQVDTLLQVVNASQLERQGLLHLLNGLQQENQEHVQLVNALQQAKQELMRKNWELQNQLLESQREVQDPMSSCPGVNRPSEKR